MNKGYALFAVAALCACNHGFKPTYTPAAKGTSVGSPVTAMMDSAGGTVTSADGRLEVTFPAGVLNASTQISIQPITNTEPNGLGNAYRLSPEGTTFAQPVTLTFHLSDMETTGLDSTFISYQHADGLWYSQPNQTRSSTSKTVSVQTSHFSDWSLAQTIELKPPQARVRTNDNTTFTAQLLIVKEDDDELANPFGDELAVPSPTTLDNQINGTKIWAVNSITGGNDTLGIVSDPGRFVAPGQMPNPSTVTVTLTVDLGKSKVIAPALAEIYANELWVGSTDVTQVDGTKVHAEVTFTQKPGFNGTDANLQFIVESGTVTVHVPTTTSTGCPQSLSPDSHQMTPTEGSMSVTYDLATGPEDAKVVGSGTSAWEGTYTYACPNGTQTVQAAVSAMWWPIDTANPMGGLTAQDGVLDGTITSALGTGTIHFVRQ